MVVESEQSFPKNEEYTIHLSSVETSIIPPDAQECINQVLKDPWDTCSWLTLLTYAQTIPIHASRPLFRAFLSLFPTSARFWRFLLEEELLAKHYEQVETIIPLCLHQCLDPELWALYLLYVRVAKANQPDASQTLLQAYELALQQVGRDANSSSLWLGYLVFLQGQETSSAAEQGQKIQAVRKVYHRALGQPLMLLEVLWKEYDQWEHSLNRDLAKEMVAKVYPRYLNAKQAQKESKKVLEQHVCPEMLARPADRCSERDLKQVLLRKKVIEWEKSNPGKLGPEELRERVDFVYRQSLLSLRLIPEMWIEYSGYYLEQGDVKGAGKILVEAVEVMPGEPLMTLALAGHEELHKNVSGARKVFERFLQHSPWNTCVYIQFLRFARRCEGAVSARKLFVGALRQTEGNLGWQFYAAAAEIELVWNRDEQAASRIWSHACKSFCKDNEFMQSYLRFLWERLDFTNMRVVVEQALSECDGEGEEQIWEWLLRLQMGTGDLQGIHNVQKRWTERFPGQSEEIQLLIDRYSFNGVVPCPKDYLEKRSAVMDRMAETSPEVSGKPSNRKRKVQDSWAFRPDVSKMTKFHPAMIGAKASSSSVPSYVQLPSSFQLPHSVLELLHQLPPAQGLFARVSEQMDLLLSSGLEQIISSHRTKSGGKSAISALRGHRPPPRDVFRKRQLRS